MALINKKSVCAIAVALLCLNIAHAETDIGKKMESMFNSLSNTSTPGAFETEARGVLSGGSLVVRNQLSSVSLAHLQLPSLEAGCGGIDFFGGSFSFINADQLVEFMKNIASNAIGYAFQMALEVTCKPCMVIIRDLQALAQSINNMNFNSCQIAQGIMTQNTKALNQQIKKFVEVKTATFGLAGDIANAFNRTDGESGTQKAVADSTNSVRSRVDMNIAYRAAKLAGAAALFTDGESERSSLEFLMSLTGTVVQKLPQTEDGEDALPVVQGYESLVTFKDFVKGNLEKNSSGTDEKTNNPQYYSCDESENCLNPTKTTAKSFKGIERLIVDRLTTPGAETNLAHVFRTATTELTPTQKNAMTFMSGMTKYIKDLSMISEALANRFVIETAPIIAGEVAFNHGYRIFQEMNASLRAVNKDVDVSEAQKIIAASWAKFEDGYRDHITTYGGMTKLLDIYEKLMRSQHAIPALTPTKDKGKE